MNSNGVVGLQKDSVEQFLHFFGTLSWHYGGAVKRIELLERVRESASVQDPNELKSVISDLIITIGEEVKSLQAWHNEVLENEKDNWSRATREAEVLKYLRPAESLQNVLNMSALLLPLAQGDFRVIVTLISLTGSNDVTWSSLKELTSHDYCSPFYKGVLPAPSWLLEPAPNPVFQEDSSWQQYLNRYESFWADLYEVSPAMVLSNIAAPWFSPRLCEDFDDSLVVYQVLQELAITQPKFNINKGSIAKTTAANVMKLTGSTTDENVDVTRVTQLLDRIQSLQAIAPYPTALPALMMYGFSDAHSIYDMPRESFVNLMMRGKPGDPYRVHVSRDLAEAIYQAATDIVYELAEALAEKRDARDPANPIVITNVDPNAPSSVDSLNTATLMGLADDMDLIILDDRSTTVTSPAAYFVDLLELLKATNATLDNGMGPDRLKTLLGTNEAMQKNNKSQTSTELLYELFLRRPDLPYLQLSAENTNTVMPYLDLANEVMTQVIYASTEPRRPPIYYDAQPGDDSADLLAKPKYLDYKVYERISGAVPIGSLPYDPHLDRIRTLLKAMGSSFEELLLAFPKNELGVGGAVKSTESAGDYQVSLEFLNMADEEIELLLAKDGYVVAAKRMWGFPDDADDFASRLQISNIKAEVLPRTLIEITELADVIKTEYINPGVLLPNGYLKPTEPEPEETEGGQVVSGPGPIVIVDSPMSDLDGRPGRPGLLPNMKLLHLDNSPLSWEQLWMIQSFIRVWKRLQNRGISMQDLDDALLSFSAETSPGNKPLFEDTLRQINLTKQISELTGVDLQRVLTCFGSMPVSLYKRIFVRRELVAIDPVFQLDDNNEYLGDPSLLISEHLPVLLAALKISEANFSALQTHLQIPSDGPLNMATLTKFVRCLALIDMFGVDVAELDSLMQFITDVGGGDTPTGLLRAFKFWSRLTVRFPHSTVIFAATGQDLHNISPSTNSIVAMAKDLAASIGSIRAQYPDDFSSSSSSGSDIDPTATAEAVLRYGSLRFGPPTAKEVLDFLEGRRVVRINLPDGATPNPFDSTDKLLISSGELIATGLLTEDEFDKALAQNGNPGWKRSLDQIKEEGREFYHTVLGDIFPANSSNASSDEEFFLQGDVPDLVDEDGGITYGTAARKRTKFLRGFVPFLRSDLERAAINSFIEGRVLSGVPVEVIEALLEKPIDATPGSQSIGTTLKHVDAVNNQPNLEGEFNGYLVPDRTDVYRFIADKGSDEQGAAGSTIILDKTPYQLVPQFEGSKVLISEPIALTGSQVYSISIPAGLVGLKWKAKQDQSSAGSPISALLSTSAIGEFNAAISLLIRLSMVINGFKLTQLEVEKLDSRLSWGLLGYLLEYTELKMFIVEQKNLNIGTVASSLLSVFPLSVKDQQKNGHTDGRVHVTYAFQDVVSATSWAPEQMRPYNSYQSGDSLTWQEVLQVEAQLALCQKLGVGVDTIYKWVAVPNSNSPASRETPADELTLLYNGRSSHEAWQAQAAKAVYNTLRDNHRKALIGFLLHQQWVKDLGVTDADGLFELLLIDPQMGTELRTSRIKQAIAAIQLFIQRCLLGIESQNNSVLTIDDPEHFIKKWNWMGSYTMWEANRKVFLFPENWADPSLRDDKSELFINFESQINTDQLNEEQISEAVMGYIRNSYGIRSLSIQATYTEKNLVGGTEYVLERHYFGRTIDAPYTFYHRKVEVESKVWTPWKRIDAPIPVIEVDSNRGTIPNPGSYVIPYKHNGRMHLFLPQFMIEAERDPNQHVSADMTNNANVTLNVPEAPAKKQWQIQLGWIEYLNDKWTAPVLCQSKLISAPDTTFDQGSTSSNLPDVQSFRFFVGRVSDIPEVGAAALKAKLDGVVGHDGLCIYVDRVRSSDDGGIRTLPVGAFLWMNGTMRAISIDTSYQPSANLGPAAPTSFHKLYPKVGKFRQQYFETSFSNRRITVEAEPDVKDTNFVSYPDLVYTVSDVGADHAQFRNVLLPDVVAQPSADDAFQSLAGYTKRLAITDDTETQQAFGGLGVLLEGGWGKYHELQSPTAIYNTELGFHIPCMLMDKLLHSQHFELALKCARWIFDPRPSSEKRSPWKWAPFAVSPGNATRDVASTVRKSNAVDVRSERVTPFPEAYVNEWESNPFQPHIIARNRPIAYKKWVVMKYIEILIAYGDFYFRQNTLESLPLAIQLYVEASHIFGVRSQMAPKVGIIKKGKYNNLNPATFDALNNSAANMEYVFPFAGRDRVMRAQARAMGRRRYNKSDTSANILGRASSTYFRYYSNPKLVELRATIDDRLFKIRNNLSIAGTPVSLSLWEPPVNLDSALQGLIQGATACGLSLSSVLGSLDGPMSNCRFTYILEKALELCGELKSRADSYLSIKEKSDAEALSSLQARQSTTMQALLLGMKNLELEQAKKDVEVLQDARNEIQMRWAYYRALLGDDASVQTGPFREYVQIIDKPDPNDPERWNSIEKSQNSLRWGSLGFKAVSKVLEDIGDRIGLVPKFEINTEPMGVGTTEEIDPEIFSKAIKIVGKDCLYTSEALDYAVECLERKLGRDKMIQELKLEANKIGYELQNNDKQIERAQMQVKFVEYDIASQNAALQQSRELETFYRSKWTNKQLYVWMDNTYKKLFYQIYTLAYDLAKKAEKSFLFETGSQQTYIQFGYWDNEKSGLGSAEALYNDLKRLESDHLLSKPYDYEVVKNVSLGQVNPLALLSLRETGSVEFDLPEVLYDMDFPGHYARRIKSVSLSIPADLGPHNEVCCTLRLLEHKYRASLTTRGKDDYKIQAPDAFRTGRVPTEAIAVSQGTEDSGIFEVDFSNERYMPFEGAGVISKWRLDLSEFRHFDYKTISDVILHVKYTSKDGGEQLRKTAVLAAKDYLAELTGPSRPQVAVIDLKNDFPSEWEKFVNSFSDGSSESRLLKLNKLQKHLPFYTKSRPCKSVKVSLMTDESALDTNSKLEITELTGSKAAGWQALERQDVPAGAPGGSDLTRYTSSFEGSLKNWMLRLSDSEGQEPPDNMWMVVQYKM